MVAKAKTSQIDVRELEELLSRKVADVAGHPQHRGESGVDSFMTETGGQPVVRVAIANCAPDMDIWHGLRSPAQVGMHPIGLSDIWMHYAVASIKSTRFDGSPNPLAMPETFEQAVARYKRAVIISAMLAMNPELYDAYAVKIQNGDLQPDDDYCRARGEVSTIINKAIGRLALSLLSSRRAVVPMTDKNVAKVIDGTRGEYFKGRNHGPCNNHYPQGSIAVMTGLLRFGVNRLPFRDEVGPDGKVRRLLGQYASIVIFDEDPPVADSAAGISLLDLERLAWMRRVNDYTDVADEVVGGRYCPYNVTRADGSSVCGECIEACSPDALANSSPRPDGTFEDRLLLQKHRFSDGWLDFDFGNCCRDRGQKTQLYPEYVCARCEAMCAARGVRKSPGEVQKINGNATG